MSIRKKLRGILGTGASWSLAWGAVGGLLHGLFSVIGWNGFLISSFPLEVLFHGGMGLVAGTMFSTGLLLTEGRKGLSGLSVFRSSAWGAAAGLAGPVLVFFVGGDLSLLTVSTTWPLFVGTLFFGAASGGGMAVVAKKDLLGLPPQDHMVLPDEAVGAEGGTS